MLRNVVIAWCLQPWAPTLVAIWAVVPQFSCLPVWSGALNSESSKNLVAVSDLRKTFAAGAPDVLSVHFGGVPPTGKLEYLGFRVYVGLNLGSC